MTALSAVILGGAALTGGKGTILGTFLGSMVLAVLQNGMQAAGELKLFTGGETAMTFAWNPSNASSYASGVEFTPFAMTFPTDQEKPALWSGIWGFGIFKSGDGARVEAAKKWIRFLCDDERQGRESVRASKVFSVRASFSDVYDGTREGQRMAAYRDMIKGDAPYYVENADGSAGGIFPDYYALVAENTGFRFRYAVYDTQQDAIAAVKNGEADILGVYSSGLISSQKDGLVLTDSIAALSSILLTKSGSGSTQIKSIAVKLRALGSLSASLAQTFPDAELKEYENAEACRRALERGEVSAMRAICASDFPTDRLEPEPSITQRENASAPSCARIGSRQRSTSPSVLHSASCVAWISSYVLDI